MWMKWKVWQRWFTAPLCQHHINAWTLLYKTSSILRIPIGQGYISQLAFLAFSMISYYNKGVIHYFSTMYNSSYGHSKEYIMSYPLLNEKYTSATEIIKKISTDDMRCTIYLLDIQKIHTKIQDRRSQPHDPLQKVFLLSRQKNENTYQLWVGSDVFSHP